MLSQDTLNTVSISSIFYKQLFCMAVLCAAFLFLQFVLVIFWQKEDGKKSDIKMFVKLTKYHFFVIIEIIKLLLKKNIFFRLLSLHLELHSTIPFLPFWRHLWLQSLRDLHSTLAWDTAALTPNTTTML